MKILTVVLLMAGCFASSATPALGTVGGPDLAEVLGWDAKDKKVFVAIHLLGESGVSPTVLYFALDGPAPHSPQVVVRSSNTSMRLTRSSYNSFGLD